MTSLTFDLSCSRRKKDTTSRVHVFKPDDVHFLQGYPKYGRNGTVEARFFVAVRQTHSSGGTNTTSSHFTSRPVAPHIVDVNTVLKAVQSSKDIFKQDFGMEIESVKVVQIIDRKKSGGEADAKVLLIIIIIFLVMIIGLVIVIIVCIVRRKAR